MTLAHLSKVIGGIDPGIRDQVLKLWHWYEEELLGSVEGLISWSKKPPADQEAEADYRHILRAFIIDCSTCLNISSGNWVRFLDEIRFGQVTGYEAKRIDNLEDRAFFDDVRELLGLIRTGLSSPPAAALEFLELTVAIEVLVARLNSEASVRLLRVPVSSRW